MTYALWNGSVVNFTLAFDAPPSSNGYNKFTLQDTFPDGMIFDTTSSENKVTAGGTLVTEGVTFTPGLDNKSITVVIVNNDQVSGKSIVVTIPTVVADKTKIPTDDYTVTNTGSIYINDYSELETESNGKDIVFAPLTATISNTTTPNTYALDYTGEIPFTAEFTAPNFQDGYEFVVSMNYDDTNFEFDPQDINNTVKVGSNAIETLWTIVGNTIKATFDNSAVSQNKKVVINLVQKIASGAGVTAFDNIFNLSIDGTAMTPSSSVRTNLANTLGELVKDAL